MKAFTLITLVVATARIATGAEVRLMIVSPAALDKVATRQVRVALIPGDAEGQTRFLPAKLNTPIKTELAKGVWYLEVQSTDLWHQRQAFYVGDPGPTDVSASVLPRSTIKGRLQAGRGQPPSELMLYFQSASGFSGEAICTLDRLAFICAVPAGAYDARIRARGYIAVHYPALNLSAKQTLDVGEMILRRGASIVGRVDASASELPKVSVSATLSISERATPKTVTTAPTSTGLFHLDGIPPGQYIVDAVLSADRRARPVTVTLQQESEIELTTPLVIQRRKPLTLNITPPREPSGARWSVQIDEETSRDHLDTVERRLAPDDGSFVSTGLAPGRYHISIGPLSGGVLFQDSVVMDSDEAASLAIELPLQEVTGTVRLEDMPLSAELRFSNVDSTRWTTLHSDERGEFSGYLPTTGDVWSVRVRSKKPAVAHTFRNIDTKKAIDLRLPMTTISGRVADRNGRVVFPATVNVRGSTEPLLQSLIEQDGSFVIHALPPGRYSVSATAPDMQSAKLEVTISDDLTASIDPILLVLENERELHGTVISKLGPVAGASVQVIPVDVEPALGIFFNSTDTSGRFTAFVPPGTRTVDIHVAAPGLSYSTRTRQLTGQDELFIAVDDRSGTLTLSIADNGSRPVLFHNGSVIAVGLLTARWMGYEKQSGGRRIIAIPQMEPGPYTLCGFPASVIVSYQINPGSNCATAILPPFGAASLATR